MSFKIFMLGLLSSLVFIGCVPDNNVYYPDDRGGYYPRYDRYGSRYEYERERDRLEREREYAREERERLERERRRAERDHYHRPPAVIHQPRQESCPSGFYLRSSKCSSKERKRGCRDSRSSGGGQYCISGV